MSSVPNRSVFSSGRAMSPPTAETKPVQATGNEFETALRLFESEAAAFAKSVIVDSDELIKLVKQRKIAPREAARTANAMRNQIIEMARANLSDSGLAISRELKPNGKTLAECENKYAAKLFGRSFVALTESERAAVWLRIVHTAGQANAKFNMKARWYGIAGRTLLVASLAFAVYNVTTADHKVRQAGKEGSVLVGGAVGGAAAGGAVIALASNPAGWVVGVAMFVGAAVAGVGTSEVFDYFWPER